MARKNNNNLFFTCSLIEYIGRMRKQCRCEIVDYLGRKNIKRIYNYADVFHCEPIEKVATEFIEQCKIPEGKFDNISMCKYTVPDYWDIGEVYERLIEDIYQDTEIEKESGKFIIPGSMHIFQTTIQIFIISRENI